LGGRGGHRLLDQYVPARLDRHQCLLVVEGVGAGHVDRIDNFGHRGEVVEGLVDPLSAGEVLSASKIA